MTHTPSHIIITKIRDFLAAPVVGPVKRWHIGAVGIVVLVIFAI